MSFSVIDVDGAQKDFQRLSASSAALESGAPTRMAIAADGTIAYRWLQYRIDTLYVFARILLDDIAVLLDRSLGTNSIGTHTGVAKHLPRLAQSREIIGYEEVVSRSEALTERVKPFRDDYVVHRSIKKPGAARGLARDPDGRYRSSVGGITDPKPGEEAQYVVSDHPEELMVALEDYLESVLNVVEQT